MNDTSSPKKGRISRRDAMKLGMAAGAVGLLAAGRPFIVDSATKPDEHAPENPMPAGMSMAHGDFSGTVGDVDLTQFDPTDFMTTFDWGKESTTPNGATVREWDLVATEKEIEVAPGVFFPAWTYNGQVPGPTFRCREGDLLRVHFTNAVHPPAYHPLPRFSSAFDGWDRADRSSRANPSPTSSKPARLASIPTTAT